MTITIATSDQMESLGASMGALARAGDVIVLTGELGAGKTTFARGFGEALGLMSSVSSPTFVVAREHKRLTAGEPPLVHIDAYRLGSAAELEDLDIDVAHSIVLAEWAAPYAAVLAPSWLEIRFERPALENDVDIEGDQPRTLDAAVHGGDTARYEKFLKVLSA